MLVLVLSFRADPGVCLVSADHGPETKQYLKVFIGGKYINAMTLTSGKQGLFMNFRKSSLLPRYKKAKFLIVPQTNIKLNSQRVKEPTQSPPPICNIFIYA